MDFEVVAIGIVKINLCALGAGAGHRADERYLPFFEVLDPFFQVFGGGVEGQVRVGLVPIRLAKILLEKIDLKIRRHPNAELQ